MAKKATTVNEGDKEFEDYKEGTDSYFITDGIETLAFSHLHDLQNFVALKSGAELRFSSDQAGE